MYINFKARLAVIIMLLLSLQLYPHTLDVDPLKQRVIERITVVAEPDYPPFVIIDKNGKPDGFSVELILAAAEVVGIKVDFKIGIWHQNKVDLAEGRVDVIPLMGRTAEREHVYDFSLPYITLHGAIFTHKKNRSIHTIQDIKPLRVAVLKGDIAEDYVKRKQLADDLALPYTYEDAFHMLASGELDAVIAQRVMGIEMLKRLGIKSIKPLDIQLPDLRVDFCFAVREGDTELLSRLNEGLSVLYASKKFDEIYLKWFGPELRAGYSSWDVFRYTLYFVVPLIVFFTLFTIILLRKQVQNRTAELRREVDEHMKTLMSLNTQQLLFEKVEQVAKIGGWEYNPETSKVVWTKELYKIFGVDPDAYDESTLEANLALFTDPSRPILKDAIEKAINQLAPFDLELGIITPSGDAKFVWISGQPELANGRVIRIYGSLMDITDRKEAEESLQKSEEKLSGILNNITDVVWSLSWPDLTLLYLSPSVEGLYGRAVNEFQEDPNLFMNVVHPDDQHLLEKAFKQLQESGMAVRECRIIRPDGSVAWIYDKSKLIYGDNNEPVRAEGVAYDITERKLTEQLLKESEERFRIAQEMSPDGFTILKPLRDATGQAIDFTWVYENQAIARINGTDPKDVVGKRLLDLFPSHRGTHVFTTYLSVANTGKMQILEDVFVGEIVSKPTWLRMVIVSMGEDIVVLAQDITERKRAEDALMAFKNDLEVIVQEKTRELQERIADLESFHEATIDRELRMKELRDEIERLKRGDLG